MQKFKLKKKNNSNNENESHFTNSIRTNRKFFFENPQKAKENLEQVSEKTWEEEETLNSHKKSKNEKNAKTKKFYENSALALTTETQIGFLGTKEVIEKPKKMILNIQTRSYTFPCKDSSIFNCQKITILPVSKFSDIGVFIKSSSKIFIVSAIYLVLWFYIAVFVESIYKQYGNNIFKICVMPLISMLFIKLVIVVNIMLLIATIVLYFKGKAFLNNAKNNVFVTVIFKALVPPLALNHYSAILTYQNFTKMK